MLQSKLKTHEKTHAGYRCEKCPGDMYVMAMNINFSYVNGDINVYIDLLLEFVGLILTFVCSRYPTWSALRKHFKEQHNVKRCPRCDKTFTRTGNWNSKLHPEMIIIMIMMLITIRIFSPPRSAHSHS